MGLRQPGFSRVGFRRVSAATGGGASGSTSADLAATAWFVDPQNSSGVASDGNTGYTSGAPLLTLNKLFTRMGTTNGQSVAITLMSSDNLANPRPINRYIPLGNNALSITGTPTVIDRELAKAEPLLAKESAPPKRDAILGKAAAAFAHRLLLLRRGREPSLTRGGEWEKLGKVFSNGAPVFEHMRTFKRALAARSE